MMDENIKSRAEDIVDVLVPEVDLEDDIGGATVPDEDEPEEVDQQNAEFMLRAIPMMKRALDEWRRENPGKRCDIQAVKDDDGELRIVITPRE